jgi:hypothetical protein
LHPLFDVLLTHLLPMLPKAFVFTGSFIGVLTHLFADAALLPMLPLARRHLRLLNKLTVS